MTITAFDLAQRFVGVRETAGTVDNPQVLAMLKLDAAWVEHDETPWCSAFTNYVCWLLRLPRSKKLNARSWLDIGQSVPLDEAAVGFDVVVLWRGSKTAATGHVGFYAGRTPDGHIRVLGGNQSDSVSIASYPASRLLGVRRLAV